MKGGGSVAAGAPFLLPTSMSESVFAPGVEARTTLFGGFDADGVPAGVNSDPKWVVSTGDTAEVTDWADGHDRRLIRSTDTEGGRVVVSAPAEEIGAASSLWSSGLVQAVDVDRVDVVREFAVDPVESLTQSVSDVPTPPGDWMVSALPEYEINRGVAVGEDVEPASMSAVKDVLNVPDTTATGEGITVAVLDTGVNYDSSLYGSRIVAGRNVLEETDIDPSTDDYSATQNTNLHGDWVASAVASSTTGIAPDADVIPVKVLGDDGSGDTEFILDGIQYAANQGADILVMSLGTPMRTPDVEDELTRVMSEEGVTGAFVAAGNSRPSTRYVSSPASEPDTITVGATTTDSPTDAMSAYFSCVGDRPETGAGVDVAAPGMQIRTDVADSTGTVTSKELSGTSMAAPIAAGVGALMLSSNSEVVGDPVLFRKSMRDAAVPVPAASESEVGAGMVDASLAESLGESENKQMDVQDDLAAYRGATNKLLPKVWGATGREFPKDFSQ
ncbi:peptidase S8 and S53 subtilisin kexin sedolisin [Halorubrum saccharovorum DSM 1137]|uniref:Peptidase S8 and S53 subtilisin kexin sedolisin n=1 Tax=Halorubrum saccharovorum DSM 1137 TaxID=1227484 RepID=M0E0S5_9EURY|nr:S8 family serine peptidase [Halorubrum saccharovorum]ELZ40638.1 peptidase S8 and S53 subtilisin kexin sedolisin [Halorubrum saccharovorum DSM 1137]